MSAYFISFLVRINLCSVCYLLPRMPIPFIFILLLINRLNILVLLKKCRPQTYTYNMYLIGYFINIWKHFKSVKYVYKFSMPNWHVFLHSCIHTIVSIFSFYIFTEIYVINNSYKIFFIKNILIVNKLFSYIYIYLYV